MQSLIGYNKPLAQVPSVVYPEARDYDHVAYGWTFGYSDFTKSGVNTVCGYIPQTDRIPSDFIRHGNYNNIDRSVHWMNGVSHVLPASLYLNSRPSWWKEIPFPAIGPDIYGGEGPGRHSYGNPAEHCYRAIMGGNEGGPGSPYKFNAAACY